MAVGGQREGGESTPLRVMAAKTAPQGKAGFLVLKRCLTSPPTETVTEGDNYKRGGATMMLVLCPQGMKTTARQLDGATQQPTC